MWDFFKLRRRARRLTQANENSLTVEDEEESCPYSNNVTGSRSITQPFFIPTQPISESPPKCLSRLPCSQILYGERVEDFSTDCWLENHLHRFGLPSNNPLSITTNVSRNSPLYEENDDSVTGSSESASSLIDFFDLDIQNDFDFTESRPRLALEQLFIPLGESDVDEPFDGCEIIEPPPYSEFDPPPTYEEAVQHSERRSTGNRSSSSNGSSLAFMW
ncbi:uncharacterized protein LOC132716241 [Ruditapes philippinarum]|uniref:uncharacterized protein LOC132716241 n=1 Tax=Ruditapes philippinarum TaxID=129788 RepID=UPI00295C1938|nr:uncharacterized protein LOC132716241 [Ruditapes philippinarum]